MLADLRWIRCERLLFPALGCNFHTFKVRRDVCGVKSGTERDPNLATIEN